MASPFRFPGQIHGPASHGDGEKFRGNRDPEKENTAAKRKHQYRQKTGHAPTNAVDDKDLQCLRPKPAGDIELGKFLLAGHRICNDE